MGWSTPKTDWNASYDDAGNYTGDYFNCSDYNRIKENLIYLRAIGMITHPDFSIKDLGDNKTVEDYLYADEVNLIEETLDTINQHTLNMQYGNTPTFAENGSMIDAAELNRIEGAILDLYNRITNEAAGRRKFTWNFGMKGGDL